MIKSLCENRAGLYKTTNDLRLGPKILASPLSSEKLGIVVQLTEKDPSYEIQSGQMVGGLSLEKLKFPWISAVDLEYDPHSQDEE